MSKETQRIVVRAPAKINLYLEILGRRPNGYHELRSVVVPVSLCDVLEFEKKPRGIETIVTSGDGVAVADLCVRKGPDNLATRAALELKKATGYSGGVRIKLKKNIPVGGGLGGGSADAAAALTVLNQLWRTGLGVAELLQIGARMGCDIPALIHGGAVLMEGLGETVSAVPVATRGGWWVVLINPGFPVSTRDIYARCKTGLTSKDRNIHSIVSALKNGDVDLAGRHLFNGLQVTVFRKYPRIEMVAEALEKAGAVGVLLCGSGASVFGLARNERHAREIAASVRNALELPVWSKVARTLPDGVMAAHGPLEA